MMPVAPLFAPKEIPLARRALPGWARGTRVAVTDPKHPRLQRMGTVIATQPRLGDLVIKTDDGSLIFTGPERVRRI